MRRSLNILLACILIQITYVGIIYAQSGAPIVNGLFNGDGDD